MAKFVFKLDSVLRQRRSIEDECQRNTAKLMRQRMILHDQLRQMQQSVTNSKRQLTEGLTGQVDMDQISGFARFSSQVNLRANTIVRQLSQLETQVLEAQKKLLAAMRDRKALDLLRDKQLRAWQRVTRRRESARLDDLAAQAYTRQVVMELDS